MGANTSVQGARHGGGRHRRSTARVHSEARPAYRSGRRAGRRTGNRRGRRVHARTRLCLSHCGTEGCGNSFRGGPAVKRHVDVSTAMASIEVALIRQATTQTGWSARAALPLAATVARDQGAGISSTFQ